MFTDKYLLTRTARSMMVVVSFVLMVISYIVQNGEPMLIHNILVGSICITIVLAIATLIYQFNLKITPQIMDYAYIFCWFFILYSTYIMYFKNILA